MAAPPAYGPLSTAVLATSSAAAAASSSDTVWVGVGDHCSRPVGGDSVVCHSTSTGGKSNSVTARPSDIGDSPVASNVFTTFVPIATVTVIRNPSMSNSYYTPTVFSYSPTTTIPASTSSLSSASSPISTSSFTTSITPSSDASVGNTTSSTNGGAVAGGVVGCLAMLGLLLLLFVFATGRIQLSKKKVVEQPPTSEDGAFKLGTLLMFLPWRKRNKNSEDSEERGIRLRALFQRPAKTSVEDGARKPRMGSEVAREQGPYGTEHPQDLPRPGYLRNSAGTINSYPARAFSYEANSFVEDPNGITSAIPPRFERREGGSFKQGAQITRKPVLPPAQDSPSSSQGWRSSWNTTSEQDRARVAAEEIEEMLNRPHYAPQQGWEDQRWDPTARERK